MALPSQSPEVLADLIRNQLSEIRQTEALESQVHEMVVGKRQKLVALVEQFLTAAAATQPVVASHPPSITIGTAHPAQMPVLAPVPAPVPTPTPAISIPVTPTVAPVAPVPHEQSEAPLPANPSAQQVMDSLNRLMAGLKEISKTPTSAH